MDIINSGIETILINENTILFLQITLATLLGMVLGLERSIAGKTAGMRTYSLVAMGSCLFVAGATTYMQPFIGSVGFDPLRVTSGVISGVGFIGAGLIIFRDSSLRGLTTAAGLWVAAGIGITVAYQLYALAIFTTILTLFVFTIMWFVEEYLESNLSSLKKPSEKPSDI